MIWIKENDEIVGYVPILKKEYTDDEIREMSKYCYSYSKGWSKLSSLVMHIQGISYAYISNRPTVDFFEAPSTLYDVSSDFNYECFFSYSDFQIEPYIKQIFDVFENLTLYKVENYTISDLSKQFNAMTAFLSRFVSGYELTPVRNSFEHTLSIAETNATEIQYLFKFFSDNGLVLSHPLFQEADNAIIEKVKQRRDLRTTRLVKSIYE